MIHLREGEAAVNPHTGEMTIGPTPPEPLLRHDPAAKGRSRNLPCQCGSGLKTKKCHGHGSPETVQHNDPLPLSDALTAAFELVGREGAVPKHIVHNGLLHCGHKPTCDDADMAFDA